MAKHRALIVGGGRIGSGFGWMPTSYVYTHADAYLALKDEVNIKIFPHAEYNHTPSTYSPTDAYFVHLKGPRKALHRDFILPIVERSRPPAC